MSSGVSCALKVSSMATVLCRCSAALSVLSSSGVPASSPAVPPPSSQPDRPHHTQHLCFSC